MTEVMTAPALGDVRAAAIDIDSILARPVFIVGSPRSGTTWLQRLLLAHPGARGGQESNFFAAFGPSIRSFHRGVQCDRSVGLANYWTEAALLEELRSIWRKTMLPLITGKPGASLLLEKTPEHSMWIPEVVAVLPEARFIHVIRDSRSVVASMLAAGRDGWGKSWAPREAKAAAISWYRHVFEGQRDGKPLGPDRYMEVFYEDLLADPFTGAKAMFKFAGLEATDDRLRGIVAEQSFSKQKATGGTPFDRVGAVADKNKKEPTGFFRSGKADGWKSELSFSDKFVTWRFTRKLMADCGYNWAGRMK